MINKIRLLQLLSLIKIYSASKKSFSKMVKLSASFYHSEIIIFLRLD